MCSDCAASLIGLHDPAVFRVARMLFGMSVVKYSPPDSARTLEA
jgi:hypothetical protein